MNKPYPVREQVRDRLDAMLSAAFEAEPVEDGVAHTAEQILARALDTGDRSTMLDVVAALCVDTARPGFSAATLRCLGRLTPPGSSAWRSALVRGALAHTDVEVRDAAVQAAESWGDADLIDVLRAHRETEAWLANYIREVVGSLRDMEHDDYRYPSIARRPALSDQVSLDLQA